MKTNDERTMENNEENDGERVDQREREMRRKLEVRFSLGSAGPFLYNLFLFEGRMKLRVCMKSSSDCGGREAPNI